MFVGLKFFFLVLGSLASSSSSAANMSAMFVGGCAIGECEWAGERSR